MHPLFSHFWQICQNKMPHFFENSSLSSVKLQISDFYTKNKIFLMNIFNNNGPDIEQCGIPRQISDYLLYEEPTLVLCFLKLR